MLDLPTRVEIPKTRKGSFGLDVPRAAMWGARNPPTLATMEQVASVVFRIPKILFNEYIYIYILVYVYVYDVPPPMNKNLARVLYIYIYIYIGICTIYLH